MLLKSEEAEKPVHSSVPSRSPLLAASVRSRIRSPRYPWQGLGLVGVRVGVLER